MTASDLQFARIQSIHRKFDLLICAAFMLALLGSIAHDLGAAPAHHAKAGSAARQAA